MTLRDYRPEDFERICEIDRLCFPPGIAYTAGDIAVALEERDIIALVGGEEERVAGFVLARKDRRNHGRIITIDVLPEFRRAGLATRLMTEAHQRLKEAGAKRVRLETSVENAPAIAFYQKFGYRTLRRLKGYYLGKIDAYLMVRDL